MAPRVEVAKTATFTTDDKRAQYARLIVFNHGVQQKLISKDKDVNTVSAGDLQKAFKSLTGGNMLQGKDGITLMQKLSKNGSTTGRELTVAYAQEVRPFLRRGLLSGQFGRRGKPKAEKAAPAATNNKAATSKKSTGSKKSGSSKKPTLTVVPDVGGALEPEVAAPTA